MQTYYQREIAKMKSAAGYDPRHIEAFIRLAHSTLSNLSRQQFAKEVRIGVQCIKQGGVEQAEACARSFGL